MLDDVRDGAVMVIKSNPLAASALVKRWLGDRVDYGRV
jgi:hypothetical protein